MKAGKLSPEKLHELILDQIKTKRSDVLVHAQVGEDSAVIDFGDWVCVMSTDPITGSSKGMGRLAVHVSCNDLAANGAEPVGIQLVLLLPEDIAEERIKQIMQEVEEGAAELGIEILGGHTEITSLVSKPIITATAIGKARKSEYVTSAGARPGDDVVITKGAGIEGTAILALDYADLLLQKGVHPETIERASRFLDEISVLREGLLAARMGATAMHDVTEGGIYGALFELANVAGLGFDIYADQVYVRPETEEICQAVGIDPLGFISSGTMMIMIPDSDALIATLAEQGIRAVKIGTMTTGERRVWRGETAQEFVLPVCDEMWRVLEQLSV